MKEPTKMENNLAVGSIFARRKIRQRKVGAVPRATIIHDSKGCWLQKTRATVDLANHKRKARAIAHGIFWSNISEPKYPARRVVNQLRAGRW